MVEGAGALLAPPHQLEVATLVLDVAALASVVSRAGVKAEAGADARAERIVTTEAQLRVDALPRSMAVETAGRALERGVGRAQLARRKLGEGVPRKRERADCCQDSADAPADHCPAQA